MLATELFGRIMNFRRKVNEWVVREIRIFTCAKPDQSGYSEGPFEFKSCSRKFPDVKLRLVQELGVRESFVLAIIAAFVGNYVEKSDILL